MRSVMSMYAAVELRQLGESDSLTKTKHLVSLRYTQGVNSARCFECQCEETHLSAG